LISNKIELSDLQTEEILTKKIDAYEKLKFKVKPKLVMVSRELIDVEKIFKAF
jgi:hypothetical protein